MISNYLDIEAMPAVKNIIQSAAAEIKKITGDGITLSIECIKSNSLSDDKAQIIKAIEMYYDIPWEKIISKSRKPELVNARFVYMFFSTHYLKQSSVVTGVDLGNRDHTTVLHGMERVEDLIFVKDPIKNAIDHIKAQLHNDN